MSGKRIIVVLGMHRSGTSAVTRGLQVLGVDLGDKLMGGIAGNNEKGFWEDVDIYGFNNALLAKLDSAWDRLNAIDKNMLLGQTFSHERKDAEGLLRSKLHGESIFAFKDPRTAILLSFWQPVFEASGLRPSYLIAIRNPKEVAESLGKRDGISLLKGVMLWSKYSIAAVRGTHGAPRVFVSYEALLQAPVTQLRRISRALDLPSPDNNERELREYTDSFLSSALRHNVSDENALANSRQVPPFINEFYQFLIQLAMDKLSPNGLELKPHWQAIASHYADFVPLLNHFDHLEQSSKSAAQGVVALEQQTNRPITSRVSEQNEQWRPLRSFKTHPDNIYDDLSRLVYKWHLESIKERCLCEAEGEHLLVSGWVLGNTSRRVHVATRQHGVTRCYPLNVERRDVTRAVLNDASENPDKLLCGFKYMVRNDAEFDFGFEVDGWIFWIYSGVPA